ncbi:hypothetical protein CKA32_004782 [Geitlerinema sp. FC II]|nr:hypothetical protein CKA32_004782 [Geitlerinema sp. FC II]
MFLWHRLRLRNWQRNSIHLRDALKSLSNVIPPISILLFVLGFVLWGNIPSVLSARDLLNEGQETLETCCTEAVENMEAVISDTTPIVIPIQGNRSSLFIPFGFGIRITNNSSTVFQAPNIDRESETR